MPSEPAATPRPWLTLQTFPRGDALVVECRGWLTVEHASELKGHVRNAIPATKRLILDMKQLERLDSAGIGTLVAVYISAKKNGCDFRVINYDHHIEHLLELTKLLPIFEPTH
jgi:anti-sigma B factor antagonist